jgi:2-phosphoglycerate kinase
MSAIVEKRCHKRQNSREILQYAKHFQEKYILHPFWIDSSMGKKIGEISDIPDVDIAEAGCFKYILIEVRDRGATLGQSKFVVRGDASCAYHGRNRRRTKFD